MMRQMYYFAIVNGIDKLLKMPTINRDNSQLKFQVIRKNSMAPVRFNSVLLKQKEKHSCYDTNQWHT